MYFMDFIEILVLSYLVPWKSSGLHELLHYLIREVLGFWDEWSVQSMWYLNHDYTWLKEGPGSRKPVALYSHINLWSPRRERSRIVFNPSNAEATFIKCTRMQKIMRIILTKSSGYSYESPRWELSDEYPFDMVSVFFKFFKNLFVLVKLATSSIRVNKGIRHQQQQYESHCAVKHETQFSIKNC